MFSVRYPAPPILISIPDQSNVTVPSPIFSWTPVVSSIGGIFDYEFLLVPIFAGQTPLQAIESNRELAFETLPGRTTLPYTPEFLPLEDGGRYAWQITAKDPSERIPFQNEGKSEIYTFTYNAEGETEVIAELSSIEELILIPNFAKLVNLERLRVRETRTYYEIDGPAELLLEFDLAEETVTPVEISGLRIQKGSEANPIIMGGEVTGNIQDVDQLLGATADLVEPDLVKWRFGENVTMTAEFNTGDGQSLSAEGELVLNRLGVTGTVSATSDENFAVAQSDPLRAELTQLTASYPGANIAGTGSIYLMENEICSEQVLSFSGESFSTFLDCSPELEIELVEGSDLLTWQLQSLSGQLSGSWDAEELEYNLMLDSELSLKLDQDILQAERCGLSATMRLEDEDGFSTENITPGCSYPDPYLDLGIYKLQYSNPELSIFDVGENGFFDFELLFDGQLFLPAVEAIPFPMIESIAIKPTGIHFPDIEFDEQTMQPFTTFAIDAFELAFTRFAVEEQQFPWFEWDGDGPGPLKAAFDANMKFPDSDEIPACLRNATMDVSDADVGINGITGDVSADIIQDCRWEMGAGYAIHVEDASGELSLLYEERNIRTLSNMNLEGAFELGPPFACDTEEPNMIPFNETNFQFENGGFSAEIEDIIPGCPVQVGPYLARVTGSDLILDFSSEGEDIARLTADATLDLGTETDATGSFTLNVLTGEFIDLNFEIDESFEWGIPKENPVLVFDIDRAIVNESGLYINGRQSLLIDNETMGVTFDELTVDWNTFEVISGRIIFDEAFTFEAGIEQTTSELSYQATMRDSSLALTPGVLLTLAGAAVIDSDGLKTSGQSQGELRFNDIEVDDLDVIFSEQFSFGLDPFAVSEGSAELYWDEQRIAIIDPSGFRPDIGFLGEEFLPERVPLPTEEVAYLEIKRNGQLLVDAVNLGDGSYRIETKPDQPLKMVLPALQGANPAPPEVDVTLTDFIINPSTGAYISGTARASVSESDPQFDLESLGIPLTLNELIFTTQQIAQGDLSALFLNGTITLLDHEFGEAGSATLFIQNDGRVKGTLSLSGLNEKLRLQPGSDRVVYELDALAGFVDIPITVAGSPDFQFDMGGRFLIQDLDDQPVASAPLQSRLTQQGFSITDFDPSGFVQSSTLDLNFFRFTIDQISSLSLNYRSQGGFDFNAGLDMQVDLLPAAGSAIEIPLKNVEIRSDEGIVIPAQNIHDGSMPLMDAPAFDLGIFRLEPLAFRTEPFTLNIFDLSAGDLVSLIPEIDFEVTFPSFSEMSPELNQIALSVYDATFENGILGGTVYPYDLFSDPVFIPIGPAGIAVDLFEGRLYATEEGEQGMEIDLDGLFHMPDNFGNKGQPCTDTRVDFVLSLNGGFTGSAEQFLPCGQFALGPLSVGFGQSLLDLSFENDEQSAIISGTANAEIERDGQPSIQASGNLTYDLMNGSILSGNIGISEPFEWGVPVKDPLFEFTVQTAAINTAGLIFNSNGNLATGDGSVGVNFNNLAFRLSDGELTSGNVQIQNEFAMDIEFGPTRWAVTDPKAVIEYDSGIRLGFPSNITIDSDGLSSNGQSTASLRFAGEVYDDLQVNFVDMAVGLSPVSVVSGRADLLLNQDRLAYYDSGGFHLDDLAGAITSVLPDTLGLPTKEIAYIVLKDAQGEPLVQTSDSESGLQLSTNNPLPLVLAGLGDTDSNAPRVDVSFSNLTISDAFEVISGSITANVSGTPLNVDDFPIGLTAVHYKKEAGQSYKLYADARLDLPPSLSDLELLAENLILGPDGIEEALFSFGSYSRTHTEGSAVPVASHSYNNGDFEISVRGVEMNFGTEEFKFSGDLSSSFLSNSGGEPALLHYSSEYSGSGWAFVLDTGHLGSQEVPIGDATLALDELNINTNTGFDIAIDGRLKMPDFLGNNFEIAFSGLNVGTSGVSLESGSAAGDHNIGLFGDDDNFTINDPSLSIDNNHLQITTDGNLNILGRSFGFTNLQIGTNGTFQLGSGGGDLVADPVNLMDEFLVLNSLNLGVQDNKAQLTAGLIATMPEPIESTDEFSWTVDHSGNVTSTGPSFSTGGAGVDLGGFANLVLTDAGLDIQNIHDLNMTLYASADLIIDGKTIQFGTDGGSANYGIRYQTTENSLEWRITNSPTFTFEAGILDMTIEENSLSPADENAASFGVKMNTTGKLKIPGIGGSGLNFEGFTINDTGIGYKGDVKGGELSLASLINISVGSIDWDNGKTISVSRQSGTNEDPGSTTQEINVGEYLEITNSSITILPSPTDPSRGLFEGSIDNFYYYQDGETFHISIEGVDLTLGKFASIYAGFEYESTGENEFDLKVAGGAILNSPVGNELSFAAMGYMSKTAEVFRFGIFVKLDAEIQIIAPNVLTVSSIGGGFFYNPKDDTFDNVISVSGHKFTDQNGVARNGPWKGRGNLKFGIALYAKGTLISGIDAAQGSTILFLTDQFFYVDMNAALLGRDDFEAGLELLVQWSPRLLIKGSAYANMGVDPLLTSSMNMSFVLGYPEGSANFMWGFTASADFKILSFLNANGEIMVSNTGFYVDISVDAGFDIWVISLEASFKAQVWWIYGEQFGAYVEIGVNATLFKVASVGANLKGALIIDSGYLIYAEASAYVEVFLVFNGRVSIWAAIRNGKISGGKGSKSEYTSMIDDARRSAQSIKNEMDKLVAQLNEISGEVKLLKMSDEQLDRTGENLLSREKEYRAAFFSYDSEMLLGRFGDSSNLLSNISDYVSGNSNDDFLTVPPVEPGQEIESLLSEMNQKIDDLTSISNEVQGRFEESYELALEWDAAAMEQLQDIVEDPRLNIFFGSLDTDLETENIGTMPSFNIDEGIDNQNRDKIEAYRKEVGEMQTKFREAIDSVQTYINRVDQSLAATYTLTPASGYINTETGEFVFTGPSTIDKDQPSAKEVADQYVETTRAIDKYYGSLVSHFWEVSRTSQYKFNAFDVNAASLNEVITANEELLKRKFNLNFEYDANNVYAYVTIIPGLRQNLAYTNQEIQDVSAVTKERQKWMYIFESDFNKQRWQSNQNTFENDIDEFISNGMYGELFGTFIRKGIEYYYEVPKRGFRMVSEGAASTADSIATVYRNNVRGVVNAHNNFTNTIDDIYRIKSSLTLTLHGIVDLYISELETVTDSVQTNTDGDFIKMDIGDAAGEMRQLKQEIENTLQPPQINSLTISRNLHDYNNKVDLQWNATHPSGTITEYSYMMESNNSRGSQSANLQLGQLLSTGNQNSVTRYLFKETDNQVNKTMQVLVRARGPSGTAISRPGNFTVTVDKIYGLTLEDENSSATTTISQPDGSPPLRPTVDLNYEKSMRKSYLTNRVTDPLSGLTYFEWDVIEEEVYWTNTADRIEFDVYSIDPESDISGFEYALGSSVSATDIRDWTRIQGTDIPYRYREVTETGIIDEYVNTNLNDWQRIRIQNVDLSEQDHYLSIRAINGDGLESNKRFISQPIVYSDEPPSTPEFNEIEMPVVSKGSFEAKSPVYEVPDLVVPNVSRTPAKLKISWKPATSLKAGIRGYEFVVSEIENPDDAFGQSDEVFFRTGTETNLFESSGISYSDDFYVHLKAVDNAGNRSDSIATLGPLVVPDPTAPSTPIIRATANGSLYGLYLQGPSDDLESFTDRYEYSISEGFGPTVVPWSEIDGKNPYSGFSISKLSPRILSTLQTIFIPTPLTGAEEGKSYLIKFKSVNNQDIESSESWSWPITYDTSPPKTPTINLSKSGDSMTIDISNLHDPESGVIKVEYRVCDTSNYMLDCFGVPGNWGGWYDLVNYTSPRKSLFQLSKQANISNLSYNNLKVFVRITNRNGMQTVSSYEPVDIYIIPGQNQTDESDYNLNLNLFNFNF
jgi:hypothetical protein